MALDAEGDAGRIQTLNGHQGAYFATHSYPAGILVSQGGMTFMSRKPTLGENPWTSPEAWLLIGPAARDTPGGEYTPLWESGSIPAAGENAWQLIGEPNLPAQDVGTRLFLAIMNSGTTHTFGIRQEASTGSPQLPAAFAIPRLIGARTFAELKYSKIKESQLEVSGKSVQTVARIT